MYEWSSVGLIQLQFVTIHFGWTVDTGAEAGYHGGMVVEEVATQPTEVLMTVGELKAALAAFPEDYEVRVWDMGQGGLVGCRAEWLEETEIIVMEPVEEK